MSYLRALVVLIVASGAFAVSLSSIDDLNDLFIPGPKVAGVEDAWALYTNPAAISFIDGAQFVGGYAYRLSTFDSGRHFASGSVGLSLIEGLTVGLGLQLSLPQTQVGDDQGLIGGSLGLAWRYGRAFSLGARAVKQRQYKNAVADPFLLGIGVESFPSSWFSFGTSLSQVYDDILSKPELRIGIAIRPFSEKLTVSAETLFRPNDAGLNGNFSINPEIAARLDLGGFSAMASARLNNVADGISAPTIFAGLEIDFDHLGFGVVVQGHPSDHVTTGGRFRLSSEIWPSLAPKRERLVSISIDHNGLLENQSLSLKRRLFGPGAHHVEVLTELSDLARDDTVSTVLLRLSPFDFGFGRAEELRSAILDLKLRGKKTRVHFDSANAATFFVASAADEIFMSPSGEIELNDFQTSLIYLRDALANLGLSVQAITAGRYKNAPDLFTKNHPSPEVLEVRNAILDQQYAMFVEAISKLTSQDLASAKETVDLGTVSSDEAKDLGLVHGLHYADELADAPAYNNSRQHLRWGDSCAFAVIPIKGMIVSGRASPALINFMGTRSGAQDVIDSINEAADNPSACAIILRIDSPGGDALASNLIHHALLNARAKKPIIASIADIGASGAYYIASAAHEIFAPASTLTGSIGVFSLYPSAGELANKLKVTHFEIQKGKNPGPTFLRALTASETARKQTLVDKDYDLFKKSVASARNLDLAALSEAAQGRVWTGTQAKEHSLVDKLGGFSDAMQRARELAHIPSSDPVELMLLGIGAPPLFAPPHLVTALDYLDDFQLPLTGRSMALSILSFDLRRH